MQRGLHSSFGRMQCLEMLAAHEAAWRTLSWTGNASVDILVGCGEPVSVSGNVLGFRTNPGMPDQELLLLRAPSKLRNVTGKTWRIQLPHDIQDVCIDSAQDLLICYCGYVACTCVLPLHPHGRYTLVSNRFTCALFYREEIICGRSI